MSTRTVPNVEQSRRRFLKSAAKLAVYTPPAMLVVSNPSFAAMAQSAGMTYEQCDDHDDRYEQSSAVTVDLADEWQHLEPKHEAWGRSHEPMRGASWIGKWRDPN